MIYAILQGRIGNQLFIYSMAKMVAEETGDPDIVIDDSEVLKLNWVDSLSEYNLQGVRFVHDNKLLRKKFLLQYMSMKAFHFRMRNKSFWERYNAEKNGQDRFNKKGIIEIRDGYMPYKLYPRENYIIDGFFQSEKYFCKIKNLLIEELTLPFSMLKSYPGLDALRNRNSVCISIKVEHNVGSSIYDVCTNGYWKKAIDFIIEHVDNPLFFICSDNVDYVKKHLIDCNKYDCICQDKKQPVEVSLAVMALCKHYIIGNTTFGWWAQYLSKNQQKIVVAPSKWMKVDMPIDIYQDNWTLIEV